MSYSSAPCGLGQLAAAATEGYDIKSYTIQEFNVLANPNFTDPNVFTKLADAYTFFADIKNGVSYQVPGTSQVFDFSSFKGTPFATTVEEKVDTLLKAFNNIDIQNPADPDSSNSNTGKYTLPITNSDGTPATLYDLISNPTGNFGAYCSNSGSTVATVNWANGGLPSGYNPSLGHGSSVQASCNDGITCNVLEHGCSSTDDFMVSGNAADFEKCAKVSSSNPAAATAAANDLASFLSSGM